MNPTTEHQTVNHGMRTPRTIYFRHLLAASAWLLPAVGFAAAGAEPVYRVPGEVRQFDGEADYEVIAYEDALALPARSGQITVAAWVCPAEAGRSQMVFKREGAWQLLIGGWNQPRAVFAVWAPEIHSVVSAPVLTAGEWQHLAGTYDGETLTLYRNGKAVGSETAPRGSPAARIDQPLWLGANLPPDGSVKMCYEGAMTGMAVWNRALTADEIAALAATPPAGASSSVTEPIPASARTTPPPEAVPVAAAAPLVGTLGGVALALDLGPGLRLRRLGDHAASADGRLFALSVSGRPIHSGEVTVRRAEVVADDDGWVIPFDLPDALGAGVLRLAPGEEPGIVHTRLELTNGGPPSVWRVLFPLVEGLTLDEKPAGNLEFFFPFQEGWLGKGEYSLGITYGHRAWLPVLAAWHPAGGGLSLQVRDADFEPFSLLFRNAAPERTGAAPQVDRAAEQSMQSLHGESYHPDQGRAAEAFPLAAPGLTMGMATLEFPLASTQTWSSRTYAVLVYDGQGLFKMPLAAYGKWARATWWQHRPMSPSIRDLFLAFAVHERVGNRGFERGFWDGEKYILAEQAEAYATETGGHPFPELAGWWNLGAEIKTGRYAGRFYPHTAGDYEFEPRFGGAEALGAEIRRVQALGGRVCLYLLARTVWKHSKVGLAHGAEWALMNKPGRYNRDWSGNGEGEWQTDYWNLCPQVQGWQEHLRDVVRRVLTESGADAVRLDTAAESLLCYNPRHEHAKNPLVGLLQFLATVREGVAAAGPDKTLWAEFCGSDAAAMYLDGTLAQGSAPGTPLVDEMGGYGISPFRFVFPEVKCFEWGAVHRNFDYLGKRFFFNGIGLTVSDCSPEQLRLLTQRAEVMRAVGDVLGSMDCEPLVPTLVPGLLANRFTLEEREVYTLWNRSGQTIQGALINVPGRAGRRFVELLSSRACRTTRTTTGDEVELVLPDGEVALLAVFPRLIQSTGDVFTCADNLTLVALNTATGQRFAEGVGRLEWPTAPDTADGAYAVWAVRDGFLVHDVLSRP